MIASPTARRGNFIFTSESVSEGHPDKICDQISDAILDLYLAENPEARVACETMATTGRVMISGEVRDSGTLTQDDIEQRVRELIKEIGYEQKGFHWKTAVIENYLHEQSTDIARGVDAGEDKDEGAGDQGIMFGFACRETESLMPAPIKLSSDILRDLSVRRREGELKGKLLPDAKSQVSLVYEDGKPVKAHSIVVSTQHHQEMSQEEVREIVRQSVVKSLPDASWMCADDEFYVNPCGPFVIGGPDGDAGLTGRKIIVDTYGGAAPHGGGAFSGKDPTKVDRSAAYACRYLAKNVVAAGLAERCIIQISYAIGVSHPISFYVNTEGTGKVSEVELEKILRELVNLSPRGIREHLQLNRPIYLPSASYGHFGRTPEASGAFSWEKTDLVESLQSHFGNVEAKVANG